LRLSERIPERAHKIVCESGGKALSSEQFAAFLRNARDEDRDSNTVEVFVARVRRKLGASFIETVRGLGYRIGEAAS